MLELQVVKNKMENEEGMNHISVTIHPNKPKTERKVEKPVAFVLVLDASISMDDEVGMTNPLSQINHIQNGGNGLLFGQPNARNFQRSERNTKLQYVKEASEKLIDMMSEKDKLAVVSFANTSSLEYELTPLSMENKHKIKDRIRTLRTRGATNISAGLQQAFEQLPKEIKDDYHVKLILLSDGEANHGITDVDGISTLSSEFGRNGVSVTTIGVGDSYNSFFMESIATASGSMFYHLKNMNQLEEIFSNELKSSLSLTTKEVYVTIEVPKGVHLSSNLNGFQEEKKGSIFIGNLYQTQQVLVEFYTEKPVKIGEKAIQVHVRYADETNSPKTISSSIDVRFVEEEDMDDVVINEELAKLVKQIMEAQTRKNSLRFYELGDLNTVQDNIDQNMKRLHKLADSYDFDVSESLEEMDSFKSSMMNRKLSASATKMMYSASYDTLRNKKE